MPPLRLASLARTCAIGALLLLGCSLPSITGAPPFRADALVGSDIWSFTDVTLRPSVQQALYAREVMDLFVDPAASAGVDLQRLPTPSGRLVDFERDVLPHLDGEVVVALSGPPTEPQVIVLVHTDDVDGTLRLLSDAAQPRLTKDARGVTRAVPQDDSEAVVGYKNWVVYAHSQAALDAILDRIDGKGGPSLATEPRYRSVVDRLKGDRMGYGYVDIAALLERVSVSNEDARFAPAFETRGRLAYSLGFEAGPAAGVRALGIRTKYMRDSPLAAARAVRGDALQAMDRLPLGSMLAVGGSSLGTYAESLAALSADEQVPGELQVLLDQFAGPAALAVTPPTVAGDGDDLSNFIAGLFFVAKLGLNADVEQLEAVGASIAEGVATGSGDGDNWQYQLVVEAEWLAINAVAAPAELDQLPQDLLASDRMYQLVRPGFTQDGDNFFLNIDALLMAVQRQLPSTDELVALSPLRAIGVSAQTDDNGDGRAQIQVLIATH